MKHLLAAVLCLLLCGCAPQSPPEATPATDPLPQNVEMYDPSHPMELANPGQIRAYPLSVRKVRGIRPFGEDVLVLSGQGNTTLTLLTGETLRQQTSLTLDFPLNPEDPSLQIQGNSLSFFDPQRQETLVLDRALREQKRIQAPDNLSGTPVYAEEENTLYYCTPWSVMAWDLTSGIRRTLRELTCETQSVSALHSGGIVECLVTEDEVPKKLFLSTENGVALHTLPQEASVTIREDGYFAEIPAANLTLLLFSSGGSAPEMLLPAQYPDAQYYLPQDHALVTVRCCAAETVLEYYELETGHLRASLTLDAAQTPKGIINCQGHGLYILASDSDRNCDTLYRWDVLQQTPDPENTACYAFPYHTAEDADLEALALCEKAAEALEDKYGITVCLWEEAAGVQPWDYRFEAEHLAPVLEQELDMLDRCLARYPEEVLDQTISHFSQLSIRLVRSIQGNAGTESLSTATGIQFFQGTEAHVAIASGKYAEQALYHELYHVMETHILTNSTALDTWESLNPASFSYGSGQNIYLQGQTRAFVDNYSMVYPKEDRARIFEYAMLPEMEELFQPEYIQRKLATLCLGIREAYGLEKAPEVYPWEQYLVNPLAAKP